MPVARIFAMFLANQGVFTRSEMQTMVNQVTTQAVEAAEAALNAAKKELAHLSASSQEMAKVVREEVSKRPLTYTLGAAGTGVLIGLTMMAFRGRTKRSVQ